MTAEFQHPSASELLEAVREFLLNTVVGETTGAVSFHARVAANALAIVERELALDDREIEAHHRVVASLGATDTIALARQIRDGGHDHELAHVAAQLLPFAEVVVDITNPRWPKFAG